MSDTEQADYQCPACERREPWRPEAAGRPAVCACGAALIVPFQPGTAELRSARPVYDAGEAEAEESEDAGEIDAVYEAVEEQRGGPVEVLLCPDCGAKMRPGAIVCPHCGYHRPSHKRRVFRRRPVGDDLPRPALEHFSELATRPVRDFVLPGVLVVAGLFAEVALLHWYMGDWRGSLAFGPFILLLAAAEVGVFFLIALILTPVLDLCLGLVKPLTIKLGAAVVFPAAMGAMLHFLCGHGVSGIVAGGMAAMVLYLTLFRIFFEFEWPDAMLLIALVSLAHFATLLLVLWPLPLPQLKEVFEPIMAQSVGIFVIAGGVVAPHFGEA
jgi:hypothetical protein